MTQRILMGLISLVFITAAHAQNEPVPFLVNYQGQLTDTQGEPVIGARLIEFNIYTTPTGGDPVWGPQVFSDVLLDNGEFNVILSQDSTSRPVTEGFQTGDAYLGIRVGPVGGVAGAEFQPRQQFLSVPYAYKVAAIEGLESENGVVRLRAIPGRGGQLEMLGESGNVVGRFGSYASSGTFANLGALALMDANAVTRILSYIGTNSVGNLLVYGSSNSANVSVGSSGYADLGLISANNASGVGRAYMFAEGPNGIGVLLATGPNNSHNVVIGYNSGNQDFGFLGVRNANSEDRVEMFVNSGNGTGQIRTKGPNGQENVALSFNSGNANMGFAGVRDVNGTTQAGMIVNTNGTGTVYGDTKSFIIDHPTRPGMQLAHACIEGPEAAVYYRGEAQLVEGEAVVELPGYFEALTHPEGRTVLLTSKGGWSPLYLEGEVSDGRFAVKTAGGGNPGQAFYWEVKAVRADIEPLEVEIPNDKSAFNQRDLEDRNAGSMVARNVK